MQVYGKDHIYDYVPQFNGNRKLPKREQIIIPLQVIPLKEFDDYQRFCLLNSKKMGVDKTQELNEKQFHRMVASKVGVPINLGIIGHTGPITFQTIYEEIPELAGEIIEVVRSTEALTAGEQKNFLPESDGRSSAPAKKRKVTTAKTATSGSGK